VRGVFLRNAHPKQIVYLPVSPGWCRVLRPAVTTCVPEQLLHTPAVRQLLLRKLVDVVDGAAWDPDIRQRRASRTDMARAIAAAEQVEFDRLLQHRSQGEVVPRYVQWTPALEARLVATADAGISALASELGITRRSLFMRRGVLRRLGGTRPPHVRRRRADEWSAAQIEHLERSIAAGQSCDAIAAEIGRTPAGVAAQAKRLGLQRSDGRPRWTDDRVQLLERRWHENIRVPEIAAELGAAPGTVIAKARALGLPGRHPVLDRRRASTRTAPLAAA
jgi:hypothetical protein